MPMEILHVKYWCTCLYFKEEHIPDSHNKTATDLTSVRSVEKTLHGEGPNKVSSFRWYRSCCYKKRFKLLERSANARNVSRHKIAMAVRLISS